MKLSTLLLAMLSLSAVAADGITSERYPDADVVLVDEFESCRYRPDGTYERTSEQWKKILTEKGRREESTVSLGYSKRYGEAGIAYVGIVGADGSEREVDISSTVKESTDNSSMSSNIYDPLDRRIVATVPGLKIGDTVHVKTVTRTHSPRWENEWSGIGIFEWSMPIVKSTFEVIAPPTLPLRRIAVRSPLGNLVTNVTRLADGSMRHIFTVTNSPQAFPEPDMKELYTEMQRVVVSTADSWQEMSRWYWSLCLPHLEKTSPAMTNKVEELGRDLRAIFRFVSHEVRYMGLTMEDKSPGYAPHDVDVTFGNRYGVCRDKAALLVAMLRIAGFKAYSVLINVGAKLDPEVPQQVFNHAIAAVEREGGGYELMDPTDENSKELFPSYLCNSSYLVARPEGERLLTSPVPPPEANELRVESSGTLMKDGSIFLENEIRFGGVNDNAYRNGFIRMTPDDRRKFFERSVKAIARGAELIRCEVLPKDLSDTSVPLSARLTATLPEMVLRGETRNELTVPFVSRAFGMVNFLLRGNTSLDHRKYALELSTTASVRETLRLDLAGAIGELKELPRDGASRLDGFRRTLRYSVTNGVLSAERSVAVAAVEFSPEEYLELREEIKAAEADGRKRPVFAKNPLKDADVNLVDSDTVTHIVSDREWVVTNRVLKQVLTYDGKKCSAELKLGYNPAVETLELVSAVVSNLNGEVRAVSPKELNVMDCGWAARAPRYPAGKILVANLPSVAVGSFVAYTTVRHVTNAPAAFYASYTFDSTEPIGRKAVTVNGYHREVVSPRRLPDEPNQPSAWRWRDTVVVSSNRFTCVDLDIPELEPTDEMPRELKGIRDWMAKNVKLAGPGLYELPIAQQLTDPVIVLRERYATRLDYVRTMCALLRGAGYEADVILAANDADATDDYRRRIMCEHPNVRAFSSPLCRVTIREGGFLGLGGEVRKLFLGTENQYAPLGPTGYDGADYYDPERGEFGIVRVSSPEFADFDFERSEYLIRENGGVDLTVENEMRGTSVGSFRQTYSEILPEDRSRRYQAILGAIAQAATATGELETDVDSYPARQRFSCYIPDFATIQGDAVSITLPTLESSIPTLTGSARETPFAISACDDSLEEVTVRFPEGYTEIESLPKPFVFANPLDSSEIWMESSVEPSLDNDILSVKIVRRVHRRKGFVGSAAYYELIKDWNRIADARQSRTIVVRRKGNVK